MLAQLRSWQAEARAGRRRLPLIGLNGPVGAGKSTLGRQLEALAPRFGLRLCVASIDDLYLSWPERRERLAGNPFGVSRVPPGSHDLPLALEALELWREGGHLRLPRFDKTLADGQGDRAGWREQPCDALVLEGWLMGCRPLSSTCLASVMQAASSGQARSLNPEPACDAPDRTGHRPPQLKPEEWQWLPRWNRELESYLPLWQACDGLWLLRPEHWGLPRRWRFQAEARQRRAGGGWLQPDDLERIVRASLCSLPPALYQDPLSRGLSPEGQRMEIDADGTIRTWTPLARPSQAQPSGAEGGQHGRIALPPVQGVAWLDGRRRCRSLWLQASPSPSSSATG
jgi:D-glycerate 3-kinase